MHHTDIEIFKELGRLEGGQNTTLNAHILDIAVAMAGDHQRVGKALEGVRKHLGKYCDDPSLKAATIFANEVAKEARFPFEIRIRFNVQIAIYRKALSSNGDDGEESGETPEGGQGVRRRKEDDQR